MNQKIHKNQLLFFVVTIFVLISNTASRAIDSGGSQYNQPLLLALAAESFDAAQAYQQTCAACHDTGAAHAPEVGDVVEWEIRLEKGLDTLVQNSINGLNGIMPPRGLCASCSDDDLKAVVEYMLENSK